MVEPLGNCGDPFKNKPGTVKHTFSPSIGKAKEGRPEPVQGHSVLYIKSCGTARLQRDPVSKQTKI